MGSLRAASICCVLALAMALGLSACGGGAELLPGKTADEINQNLDQVRAFVAEGDCAGAEAAVDEVSEEVDGLGGVDQKLKAALRQGTDRLGEVVSSCGEEALEEAETEQAAEEEKAEQEEQEAVEAEEAELEAEEEQAQKEKPKKEAPEGDEAEAGEGAEPPETPSQSEGVEKGNGPPAETPSGNEPPAGGVGPGTEVE
ncbi:MAG TPA: hypothetical protein VGI73_09705 [Solirubrobacterales bacterium]|jgi:hypothetical protein